MDEGFFRLGVGNFLQGRLQLSSIASYQPPGDREARKGTKWALMIKLGCKGTLLCGGGRLQTWGGVQISSSSPRGCILQAFGGQGERSSQREPGKPSQWKLSIPGLGMKAAALHWALSLDHCCHHSWRSGTTKHKLAKCGRHPEKHKCWHKWVGVLGDGPWWRCTEVRRTSGATGARCVLRTAKRMPESARRAPRTARWVLRTAREGWLEVKSCAARGDDAEWSRSKAGPRAPY